MPLVRIKLKPSINELLIPKVIKRNFLILLKPYWVVKLVLPDYGDPITLASTFNMYFIDKIANIRAEFPLLESSLPPYSFGSMDSIMPTCANLFDRFTMITSEELIKIVSVMNKTTCSSDPFPSKLLMSHLPTIIDTIMHIINLCLSTSVFPASFKSAVVLPLIKKPGLDPAMMK